MAELIEVPGWAMPGSDDNVPRRKPEPAAVPSAFPALAPASQQHWSVRLPDGSVLPVAGGLGLVGRDPSPRDGEEIAHLIAVGTAERSVSKTHLAFGVDVRGFWVADRHSTNGTSVLRSDGQVHPCAAGDLVHVAPGDVVRIGALELRPILA